ncbi:MAG: hypothetical protein U0230_09150 [Polyangiales bacterium]
MSETSYPVFVLVQRPDGSKEQVRVGTAVRAGEGFRLSLGELSIGATPDRPAASAPAPAPARRASGPSSADGMVFPPYGRSKGAPIVGASIQDLEFYIQGSRRSLDDPSKARFHEKERVLLAAMEAELARQKGGGGGGGGGDRRGGGAPERPRDDFDEFDGPPPFTDDDIPF